MSDFSQALCIAYRTLTGVQSCRGAQAWLRREFHARLRKPDGSQYNEQYLKVCVERAVHGGDLKLPKGAAAVWSEIRNEAATQLDVARGVLQGVVEP